MMDRAAAHDLLAPSQRRKVLFVTSEMADFVKVGGLGVVSAALPRAMGEDFDVRVLIPGYREVLRGQRDLRFVADLPAMAALPACRLARLTTPDGLVVYVLIAPQLYERDGTPYGDRNGDWADNHLRFGRLGAAAAHIASGDADPTWSADLVHANDWPCGLAPAYLRWRGARARAVLTIHNLAYQGIFPRAAANQLGVPDSAFGIDGVEFHDRLSFLKAGIFYADHVTTVSDTYAREITRPEHGCGLDGLLQLRASEGRLTGILNGIEGWDPATDPALAAHFDASDWTGKRINKEAIRDTFGLGRTKGPLFAVVSRLVQQKGIDLIVEAADEIAAQGGQIVVMGVGEPDIEEAVRARFARRPRALAAFIGYEETLARRLLAGSDFLLMPSRFEPCGLTQMFAQRAGSLPIVRRTGGLADTVRDGLTGFQFHTPSARGLMRAVRRAFDVFQTHSALARMRRDAMTQNFSWRRSAQKYAALYLSGGGR